MTLEDQYKLLVEGYYGVNLIDEYDLKVYILKDIDKLMNEFLKEYKIDSNKIIEHVKNNVSDKVKLQSSLIILNQMNAPIELILLVKKKIKNLK